MHARKPKGLRKSLLDSPLPETLVKKYNKELNDASGGLPTLASTDEEPDVDVLPALDSDDVMSTVDEFNPYTSEDALRSAEGLHLSYLVMPDKRRIHSYKLSSILPSIMEHYG